MRVSNCLTAFYPYLVELKHGGFGITPLRRPLFYPYLVELKLTLLPPGLRVRRIGPRVLSLLSGTETFKTVGRGQIRVGFYPYLVELKPPFLYLTVTDLSVVLSLLSGIETNYLGRVVGIDLLPFYPYLVELKQGTLLKAMEKLGLFYPYLVELKL